MIASQLALAYGTYLVGTVSPGPSNMAIVGTAMRDGRMSALVLASGVITGSIFWAVLAATGVSAVLAAYAQALFVIKITGGAYLLYLAFRNGRSALDPTADFLTMEIRRPTPRYGSLYRQGVLMHLGNPKSILVWLAIVSLGLQKDVPSSVLPVIVGGCALLGVIVFCGYAILFSTAPMIAFYTRARRWLEGALCIVFAIAGLKLLASQR